VRWVLRAIDSRARIDDAAVALLAAHAWPGNFRELRSVLTRALLQRSDSRAAAMLVTADIRAVLPAAVASAPASQLQRSAAELVRAEHERCGHSVSRTARALGISRTTVYRHLRG